MNFFNSLTVKLLSVIALAFAVTIASVLFMADKQLTRIIDESQSALYKEKVEAMCDLLARKHERLQQTGMVEAYRHDFQESSLEMLRDLHYKKGQSQEIYPFILTNDGVVVMHPVLEAGDLSLVHSDAAKLLLETRLAEGGGEYIYDGRAKWCWFKRFPEWDWITGYAVPLDVKYRDARSFQTFLVYIMGAVALIVLACLSFVVARFIKPISVLTEVSTRMASGDLDQPITEGRTDEVGRLARSFNHMRRNIREKILELETENRQRQQVEVALAAEKERLSVTLRSIGDGVITTDVDGNVVFINEVAEEITGWSNNDAVGKPLETVFFIVEGDGRENGSFSMLEVIGRGEVVELCGQHLFARNNNTLIVNCSGAPIFDAGQQIIGLVLVFRDMTEQAQTERELLKISKLESVGVLAGGIAHDFNNILAAILGNINLALFDNAVQGKSREFLAAAENACLRAKDLTLQLLTFSKGGDPIKEVSSLEEVIRDSAKFVLHGDKVACQFDIVEGLWLARIDKGQISQVIQNIVLNASVAMPDGGLIRVTAENVYAGDQPALLLEENGRYVKITIRDEGVGMSTEILERIFDPYFSTKASGSGLGLAISQSIVLKHHGHIGVESTPGNGSVFSLYLPATKEDVVPSHPVTPLKNPLSCATVLIMDDEDMVRQVAEQMLMALGHKVVLAEDGEEAIACYRQGLEGGERIDLVIMDLTIPGGMGGKEAVQEILKIDAAAKVVVSSGYSNDPAMANFKEYGFTAAMVKPFQLKDLSRVLEELI